MGVKICFGLKVRRGVDCFVGGSLKASRPGVVLTCVVRLTASEGVVSRSASLLLGFGGWGVGVRTSTHRYSTVPGDVGSSSKQVDDHCVYFVAVHICGTSAVVLLCGTAVVIFMLQYSLLWYFCIGTSVVVLLRSLVVLLLWYL